MDNRNEANNRNNRPPAVADRFARLRDEPLDQEDDQEARVEALRGRLADLLSDRKASVRTIELLESFEEQLQERGWLSARQRALVEEIENRRFSSRSGRF